jgi:hypothetical protein
MAGEQDDRPELSKMFLRMTEVWRESAEKAGAAGKLWSDSMMPFLTARATDSSLFGAAQGGEITEAIKRMAEGPKLADIWNLDREIYTLMAAWMEIQQRLATYRAVVSVPWNRAFERYGAALQETQGQGGEPETDWRKAFGVWSGIANEELIRNQRSEEFLSAQRELLRSALAVRTQQQKIGDSLAKLFGLPTQQDFDEVTRQLTEMRRELRAHLRSQRRAERAGAGEASEGRKPAPAAAKRAGQGRGRAKT